MEKDNNECQYFTKEELNTLSLGLLSLINGVNAVLDKVFIDDIARDYSPDQFAEDLEFLCESGYMANMIDMKFEITSEGGAVDIGRMCPCDAYIVVKMKVADSKDLQKIEEILVDEPEESD